MPKKNRPRALGRGDAGKDISHVNCTLSLKQRQALRWIMDKAFQAIDRRRFTFAEQLVDLALAELGRFEMASGSAVQI